MTDDSKSEPQAERAAAALSKAGYKAWYRPPLPDSEWTRHIHDTNDPETREALAGWFRAGVEWGGKP